MGIEPPPKIDLASLIAGANHGKASGKNPGKLEHYKYAPFANKMETAYRTVVEAQDGQNQSGEP